MVTTMRAEERAWPAAVSRRDDEEAMSATHDPITPSTPGHPDAPASVGCRHGMPLTWGDAT
jgi:hypothetical protein